MGWHCTSPMESTTTVVSLAYLACGVGVFRMTQTGSLSNRINRLRRLLESAISCYYHQSHSEWFPASNVPGVFFSPPLLADRHKTNAFCSRSPSHRRVGAQHNKWLTFRNSLNHGSLRSKCVWFNTDNDRTTSAVYLDLALGLPRQIRRNELLCLTVKDIANGDGESLLLCCSVDPEIWTPLKISHLTSQKLAFSVPKTFH